MSFHSLARIGRLLTAALVVPGLFSIGAARAVTFTVTTTADSGAGSFRQAILDANAAISSDIIGFAIPGAGPHTIKPASALPTITSTVLIDGFSQPGAAPSVIGGGAVAMIELDGSDAGADASGLVLNASLSTIKGLAINRFGDAGIVVDFGQVGNVIQGNLIGVDIDGATLAGNGGQGVDVMGNNTLVGGTCAGCGNVIAGNREDGVFVLDSNIHNAIRRNSIHDNGGSDPRALGIDLYLPTRSGFNENDACDGDSAGGNLLQNFPVITSAESDGTSVTIEGTLNSLQSLTYALEFFASTACDKSGYGEGKTFLGTTNVIIGAEGCTAGFAVTLPVAVADRTIITATATEPDGNTSEFSRCFTATGPQPHDLAVTKLKTVKKVTLNSGGPDVTKGITVTIQNRSPHSEIISTADVLAELVTLTVESLPPTACKDPEGVRVSPEAFPVTIASKKSLNVTYNVTFGCANDRLQSRPGDPHNDFRVLASVDHSALDGEADSHPLDDLCPRGPLPANDPYPDGTVKDKGCGGRDKATRQLGADVLIDVVVRGGE